MVHRETEKSIRPKAARFHSTSPLVENARSSSEIRDSISQNASGELEESKTANFC